MRRKPLPGGLLLSTPGVTPASASPASQGAAATDAQIGTATVADIPVTLHGDLAGFRWRTAIRRIEDGVEILRISLSRDRPAPPPTIAVRWVSAVDRHGRDVVAIGIGETGDRR